MSWCDLCSMKGSARYRGLGWEGRETGVAGESYVAPDRSAPASVLMFTTWAWDKYLTFDNRYCFATRESRAQQARSDPVEFQWVPPLTRAWPDVMLDPSSVENNCMNKSWAVNPTTLELDLLYICPCLMFHFRMWKFRLAPQVWSCSVIVRLVIGFGICSWIFPTSCKTTPPPHPFQGNSGPVFSAAAIILNWLLLSLTKGEKVKMLVSKGAAIISFAKWFGVPRGLSAAQFLTWPILNDFSIHYNGYMHINGGWKMFHIPISVTQRIIFPLCSLFLCVCVFW